VLLGGAVALLPVYARENKSCVLGRGPGNLAQRAGVGAGIMAILRSRIARLKNRARRNDVVVRGGFWFVHGNFGVSRQLCDVALALFFWWARRTW